MEWFRISTSTELVRVGAIHAENGMGTAGNIHVGQTFHLNLYQRAGRTGTIFWESSSKAKHKNGNKKDAFAHDFYHNISLITLLGILLYHLYGANVGKVGGMLDNQTT